MPDIKVKKIDVKHMEVYSLPGTPSLPILKQGINKLVYSECKFLL